MHVALNGELLLHDSYEFQGRATRDHCPLGVNGEYYLLLHDNFTSRVDYEEWFGLTVSSSL